jgi:hypothetical protein
MPANTLQSVSWPLKLLFVTTFVIGMIGLLWLRIGGWTETISWVLIGISIATALMLLFPTFAEIVRKGAITAGLSDVANKLEINGPIGTKLDAAEARLGDRLKNIEKQLENVVRPTDGSLALVESKLDGRLAKIDERLGQLSNIIGEKNARLAAIRAEFDPQGAVGKQLKGVSDASDDAVKLKPAIASLQKAIDDVCKDLDAIR